MHRLQQLCVAARALHSQVGVSFLPIPDQDDLWAVRIAVGDVIFVETAALPLKEGIAEATEKLKSLSQRTLTATLNPSEFSEDKGPPTAR
jgi:hypothetical protein